MRFSLASGAQTERRALSSGETRTASVCLPRQGDTAVLRLAPSPQTEDPVRLVRTLVRPLPAGRSCSSGQS